MAFRNIRIQELPDPSPPPAFQPLFNGKDLDGWAGDTKTWTWKDGKLVGDTKTGPRVFQDCCLIGSQQYRDFDLKFRARFDNPGGIYCGVAIRNDAKAVADAKTSRGISGPDVAIGKNLGGFYTVGGIGKYLKTSKNKAALDQAVKVGFNDFHIRCVGKRVTITVNGVTTIDDEYPEIPSEGVIAFHVLRFPEAGNWQTVTFEDIQFREISLQSALESLFNGKAESDNKQIREWVRQLDSGVFTVRTEANAELVNRLDAASPILEAELPWATSTEMRQRIQALISAAPKRDQDLVRREAASRVLEYIPMHKMPM